MRRVSAKTSKALSLYSHVEHYTVAVRSERCALHLALTLVSRSFYFVALPLPNDVFEFSVKLESRDELDRIISALPFIC